jgi:hypothetical protein
MKCRHCESPLSLPLIDLGTAPPSNAYLTAERLDKPERRYPLRVLVCERCWLAQTEDFADAHELFDAEYAYFSSTSTFWLAHAERYVADMVGRLGIGPECHVVEVAANDGYLLQYVKQRGIPCTGVEPTASTAAAARARGIDIVPEFFGRRLAAQMAAQGLRADLAVPTTCSHTYRTSTTFPRVLPLFSSLTGSPPSSSPTSSGSWRTPSSTRSTTNTSRTCR